MAEHEGLLRVQDAVLFAASEERQREHVPRLAGGAGGHAGDEVAAERDDALHGGVPACVVRHTPGVDLRDGSIAAHSQPEDPSRGALSRRVAESRVRVALASDHDFIVGARHGDDLAAVGHACQRVSRHAQVGERDDRDGAFAEAARGPEEVDRQPLEAHHQMSARFLTDLHDARGSREDVDHRAAAAHHAAAELAQVHSLVVARHGARIEADQVGAAIRGRSARVGVLLVAAHESALADHDHVLRVRRESLGADAKLPDEAAAGDAEARDDVGAEAVDDPERSGRRYRREHGVAAQCRREPGRGGAAVQPVGGRRRTVGGQEGDHGGREVTAHHGHIGSTSDGIQHDRAGWAERRRPRIPAVDVARVDHVGTHVRHPVESHVRQRVGAGIPVAIEGAVVVTACGERQEENEFAESFHQSKSFWYWRRAAKRRPGSG